MSLKFLISILVATSVVSCSGASKIFARETEPQLQKLVLLGNLRPESETISHRVTFGDGTRFSFKLSESYDNLQGKFLASLDEVHLSPGETPLPFSVSKDVQSMFATIYNIVVTDVYCVPNNNSECNSIRLKLLASFNDPGRNGEDDAKCTVILEVNGVNSATCKPLAD